MGSAQRRQDFYFSRGQIAGDLKGHERGNFVQKIAEIFGGGVFVAEESELVLDQGVVDEVDFGVSHHTLWLARGNFLQRVFTSKAISDRPFGSFFSAMARSIQLAIFSISFSFMPRVVT